MTIRDSGDQLRELLAQRILVLDGAMGTVLQTKVLTVDDFGGPEYEGCNEQLNLTRPDVVTSVFEAYLDAGADIVETNTFGSTPLVLAEYGLADRALEISRVSASLARAAADSRSTPDRPRFVAGSMGPTTKTISVTGGVTFQELVESFTVQATGLIQGGVDLLLLETAQDTLNIKAAAVGIADAQRALGARVPLMVSGTIEPMGTMLAGQGVEALYTSLEHLNLFSIGLNCATGPEFMTDHLRSLADMATCFVSVYPNAGLPDEEGRYAETPRSLASKISRFVDEGWVNLVGGCCGTTPAHIAAIAELCAGRAPRTPKTTTRAAVSGIEYLTFEDENRPIIVGERTNVIGSRKFKDMIADGKIEEAAEIGRAQVKNGAQIIDVCMANPDRNELADMDAFLAVLTKKVKAPLMIDSTDSAVIEAALIRCQGKSVVNSINLEDGEERFAQVVPIIRRYGAAVVVGCIDEDPQQGMAVTRDRKLEVAKRAYDLLVNKYGIPPRDLIFDALVFPVGTGDVNYIGSAVETIEGIRSIKAEFPQCKTILGVSNVSFGLPPAGREVLNAVYLYHNVKAGLDLAIVNAEKLERYPSIPEAERQLAEDLIYWRGSDPVAAFAAHFKGRQAKARPAKESLPLDERLARYILEGSRDGLTADLDEALKTRRPIEIINGPLMAGMDEVGRLFNRNELIVAEVLQSAEAMKAAVRHLEPYMEKADASDRGKILLATVKGDVHDIGKNLVEIILGNNGFKIINLGIKVAPEVLIDAYRRERPDMIGLSGLLVKSAQQMVITAQDLRNAGVDAPILVGGAALSNKFTATKIAPEYGGAVLYAKDAMMGLDLANRLSASDQRAALIAKIREEQRALVAGSAVAKASPTTTESISVARSAVRRDVPVAPAPDFDRHVIRDVPLGEAFAYINPVMLYGKHLGLRGQIDRLLAERDETALKLHDMVEALKREVVDGKLISAHAVWRFFPCQADGNTVLIYDPEQPDRVIERFVFPRQSGGEHLCLADYVRDTASGERDAVAMFAVTCGIGVRDLAQRWKDTGEYLRSHALQALAVEGAEGLAEWLHRRLRTAWGFPDPPATTVHDVLKNKYRGIRVSFGYPACPNLSDQRKLFSLLRPEDVGIELTDGDMMDPEASVSALVFHHPDAKYFRAE